MKKLLTVVNGESVRGAVFKAPLIFVLSIALGSGFWAASLPLAQAQQQKTPAEMIQSKLPTNKTIPTASDAHLMEAVCKAVKQWPKEATLIVRTAAGARKTLKPDIFCMAIRCLRDVRALDCGWIAAILGEWIRAEPEEANRLTELVLECAPECQDRLHARPMDEGEGGFVNPPGNINPPPGSSGGSAGGNVCIVCHNGREVQISCSDVNDFLRDHSGATSGPCQVTPSANP